MFTRAFISKALVVVFAAATMLASAPSCPANPVPRLPSNSIRAQTQNNEARKFDEFGWVGECDAGARLDNFAIQLLNAPTTTGYIIGYDGRDTLPARIGYRHLSALHYLVNARGLNPNRLVAIKGGMREEELTELWIAPKDAPAPEPTNTIIVEREAGKSFKYDEFHPQNAVVQYEEEYTPPQQLDEEPARESAVIQLNISPSEAQSIAAQPEIVLDVPADHKAESEEEDYNWASEDYAQVLEKEQGIACVIYYAQREGGHLFKLQQIMEGGQNLLVKKHGFKEERIKIIFGGYRESTIIEMWVVPPGASLPMPAPDYAQEDDENINEPAEEVAGEAKSGNQ